VACGVPDGVAVVAIAATGPGGGDTAACQREVEGALAVGAVAPALVPLGAHQPRAAEEAVDAGPVGAGPEALAGAQDQL
jgi:hypothetical protein